MHVQSIYALYKAYNMCVYLKPITYPYSTYVHAHIFVMQTCTRVKYV